MTSALLQTCDLHGAAAARFSELRPEIAADPRIKSLVAVVEASSRMQYVLHERWCRSCRWQQDQSGWVAQVGEFGGMPVTVALTFARIDDGLVCFYEAISTVVHHQMVERWIDAYCRGLHTMRVRADRFPEVMNRLRYPLRPAA